MAEEVVTGTMVPGPTEAASVNERTLPAISRISWGAIFGGAFAAMGIWLLLYALGLAVGLSTIDPNNPGSVKGSGMFTGIWSGISPLLALFVGGLVAARLAGVFERLNGAMHGLVMWGLVAVFGAWMAFAFIASIISGGAMVGRTVAQGGGEAIKGAAAAVTGGVGTADQLGLNWDDALGPVNQRLRAEGKPTVTADQLKNAARDGVQNAVRSGSFDRDAFANALAQNTALSPADVQQLSERVQAQADQAISRMRAGLNQAVGEARTGALKAADVTGKAFWGVFAALLLGLIAAVVGGALGVRTLRAANRRQPRRSAVNNETSPRGPIIPPRRAHT